MQTKALIAGGTIVVAVAGLLVLALSGEDGREGGNADGAPQGAPVGERVDPSLAPGQAGGGQPGGGSQGGEGGGRVIPDGPQDPDPADAAGLAVQVVDAQGRPIPGASASAYPGGGAAGTSDGQGRLNLAGEGVYRFSAQGYASAVRPIEAAAVVTLLPAKLVRGEVWGADAQGRPEGAVAGATIQAESETWTAEARSGQDGSFAFEDVPEGEELILHVVAPGFVGEAFAEADLPRIVLSRGGPLELTIYEGSGAPAVGAQVRLFRSDVLTAWTALTADAQGKVRAEGLSPTELVRVEARTAAEGVLSEWAQPDDLFELQVAPFGALVIEGCPADVQLRLEAEGMVAEEAGETRTLRLAAGPGDVRFSGLVPAVYLLTATEGAPPTVVPVIPGEEQHVRFAELTRAPEGPDALLPQGTQSLRVRVTDERGAPLSGVEVQVTAGPETAAGETDALGECRFAELPRVAVSATASAPGKVLARPGVYDPEVDAGELVTLVLAAPVVLEGSIGAPAIPLLRLRPSNHPDDERTFEGTPDGRFHWPGLPPGSYDLEVGADGYLPQELSVRLPLGRPLELTLELWKGHDHGEGDEHDDHDH
ncbi:MAG: hypothetical protein R3F62_19950 [Planctomycetota bacterium]